MSKISKKKIDQLFKAGSDRYGFSFNPQAWKKMEDLLDREKRRRVLLWWWFGILGLLILGFSFIFILKIKKNQPKEEIYQENAHISLDSDRQTLSPKTALKITSPAVSPDTSHNGGLIEKSKEEIIKSAVEGQPTASKEGAQPSNDQQKNMGGPPTPKTDSQNSLPTVSNLPKNNQFETLQRTATPISTENLPGHLIAQITLAALLPGLAIQPIVAPIREVTLNMLNIDPPIKEQTIYSSSRLLLGVLFSPEFNTIGYRHFSALSSKWGFSLEYQYARKLGITSGIQLVNKKYVGGKGSYSPPKGFWTRKIAPIETEGECTILEIPIGLTYYLNGHHQSGFFSEVGMSSFLMLEEHYHYYYDQPDNDLIRYWGAKNENQHWMGIFNVSIGYNFMLSQKMTARLAPYTQIPIEGIGHGKVDLYSLGLQFSFQYELLNR